MLISWADEATENPKPHTPGAWPIFFLADSPISTPSPPNCLNLPRKPPPKNSPTPEKRPDSVHHPTEGSEEKGWAGYTRTNSD